MQKKVLWGDQGDGTYRNPILNADYPDVDIEQVGDTYYMIASKKTMAPGMIILESKDMVNWAIIGHVWEKLSWHPKYNWDQMNGYPYGVWAGDIAYHDGTWYCYHVDATVGIVMSSAKDILGPWTEPHVMRRNEDISDAPYCDDPSVYWDDENHQAYLGLNAGPTVEGVTEIRMFKMSWDGRELLDEGQAIYHGLGAEALKIYRLFGKWYLFMAEWFMDGIHPKKIPSKDHDRKQIVLRSTTDSIYGPFEKKVVLQRGNGIERSCSQGGLLQAPDGSWWYMHQLIQNCDHPFEGRPQMLEPIQWVDGWPIIGVDVNGDGIGEPVIEYKKPIDGYPIMRPETDDDFFSPILSHQWEWNHNPRDTHWSLTDNPGHLRLYASVPVNDGGFWNACNTISQRVMGTGKGCATAKLDIRGMAPGQKAGFVRFGGVYHMLGITVDETGQKFFYFEDNDGEIELGSAVMDDILFIRSENESFQAQFSYSFENNSFTKFGPQFPLAFGRWLGDRLGIYSYNELTEDGFIDVAWFQYEYWDE
jgi:beta-xylosidase